MSQIHKFSYVLIYRYIVVQVIQNSDILLPRQYISDLDIMLLISVTLSVVKYYYIV